MARRPRVLAAGAIYHVTCRGNERRDIFRDDADRQRFVERLEASAATYQVRVYLYCLMANHVHLLVETPLGNLSKFMGSLLTGYTVYFNRRHRRSGHLMQGRFGAQWVEGNAYLLKLSRYIHLNPVQVGVWRKQSLSNRLRHLRGYRWSSLGAYTGRAEQPSWLSVDPILALLEGAAAPRKRVAYGRYVEAGLAKSDEEFVALMTGGGVAIGSAPFVEKSLQRHRQEAARHLKREDVALRHLRNWRTAEEVEVAVKRVVGAGWQDREAYWAGRLVRGLLAWGLHRHAGMTQRAIAPHVGVGTGAAVCLMLGRVEAAAEARPWREALDLIFKG